MFLLKRDKSRFSVLCRRTNEAVCRQAGNIPYPVDLTAPIYVTTEIQRLRQIRVEVLILVHCAVLPTALAAEIRLLTVSCVHLIGRSKPTACRLKTGFSDILALYGGSRNKKGDITRLNSELSRVIGVFRFHIMSRRLNGKRLANPNRNKNAAKQ